MTVRTVGTRTYSYLSVRRGKRVLTRYIGTGPLATIMVGHREAERERIRAERRADDERIRLAAEWSGWVDGVVRLTLERAGYHRHKQGEWRKRKVGDEIQATGPALPPMTPEVRDIERRWRAHAKDITAAEARKLFLARPGLLDTSGLSPATNLLACHLSRYDKDPARREPVRMKYLRVKDDLAGPGPTPMESLLAERAALCWLDVNFWEAGGLCMENGNASNETVLFTQKRIDASHRRFLAAVRTLAVVRKLKLPHLLVHVDQRSVHYNTPAPEGVATPTIHVPAE